MTKKEVLKMALKALVNLVNETNDPVLVDQGMDAIMEIEKVLGNLKITQITKEEALKIAIEAIENSDINNDLEAIEVIKQILEKTKQKD